MQKKLYRSRTDRRIAGVCGGIAEFFNMDSMIVRLIFGVVVALCLLPTFGSALLLYIVLVLAIPLEPMSNDYYQYHTNVSNTSQTHKTRKDVTPK